MIYFYKLFLSMLRFLRCLWLPFSTILWRSFFNWNTSMVARTETVTSIKNCWYSNYHLSYQSVLAILWKNSLILSSYKWFYNFAINIRIFKFISILFFKSFQHPLFFIIIYIWLIFLFAFSEILKRSPSQVLHLTSLNIPYV